MKLSFTPYIHSSPAFREVEEFLSRSYARFNPPRNWLIDRWNFTATVSRVMNGKTIAEWEEAIGLWRDEAGKIIAMAHEEENKGDVFFEFADAAYFSQELFKEMFDFAEHTCCKTRGKQKGFALRIPRGHTELETLAAARGYRKLGWAEPMSLRPVRPAAASDPLPLPHGLSLITGSEIEPGKKALAHAHAFGYANNEEQIRLSSLAFAELLTAPSYRADLDLALATKEGEIASFAGVWLDSANEYGILEPVGTIPEYRRKGLAAWLITEGERRIAQYGMKHLYVGSDQDFYQAIGFKVILRQELWEYLK